MRKKRKNWVKNILPAAQGDVPYTFLLFWTQNIWGKLKIMENKIIKLEKKNA